MYHTLLCVDPSLGRLDYTLLSDQACFEIFFENCTAEQKRKLGVTISESDSSVYVDVCDWKGAECDEDGNLIKMEIKTSVKDLHKLNFGYIPSKLKSFLMHAFQCNGEVHMSDLPLGLEKFGIFSSRLRCTLETKDIPRSLKVFIATESFFEGTCDLTVLPGKLESLVACSNHLVGTLNLNHLPASLFRLDLSRNVLTGPIHISNLPVDLRKIDLSFNNFSGSCVLTGISDCVMLDISNNNLSGTAILPKAVRDHRILLLQKNRLSAFQDEQGSRHYLSARLMQSQRAYDIFGKR